MAENTITFKLIPNMNKPLIRESRVRLRALFDYDPVGDKYIPCKEAGLSFHKGDILHIVSQDDPYWYEFILSKGQIKSECIYEIIDFSKYHLKKLLDFCPGRFYRLKYGFCKKSSFRKNTTLNS